MESSTKLRLAVAGAALTGCAVGAVAFGPSFAWALQDDDGSTTTTTAPAEDETASADCGPGGRFGLRPGFEAAAEAIGIEVDALREALQGGQTIAEVAEANGVAVDDVIAAMVADAQERLAQAVTDGRITQEQADERSADLEQRITDLVNGELPFPGPGHRGPRPDAEPD
jgi:hypothetical protein